MNFSTNQVKQFYVLKANSVVTYPTSGNPRYLVLDGERTDLIPAGKVLHTVVANADDASQLLKRKGVLIALNSNVNSGAPVAGQNYILNLTYRGHIGEEDTYHKFAEAKAYNSETAAQLLQALAQSLMAQRKVEAYPLYDLFIKGANAAGCLPLVEDVYTAYSATSTYALGAIVKKDGIVYKCTTAIDTAEAWTAAHWTSEGKAVIDAITSSGFYIVEPVPYWALGKFPETLLNIELSTPAIIASAVEEDRWLANYKFAPIASTEIATLAAIVNSHKVADLEYFCKGERGVSAGLHAPYDVQLPLGLKVNPSEANGYDILNIHYAFKGDNQQSTLSEKDITIVIPADSTFSLNGTSGKTLADIKTAVDAF